MNIILGASGQVGSAIVEWLQEQRQPVKAVVHSADKADALRQKGVEVAIADAEDQASLRYAFRDGTAAFVLTPETGKSEDVIGDTRRILENYRAALEESSVSKIVGLSSMGAQYAVGNLEMSYLLERAFTGLDAQCLFVRPAYYYSNWLLYLPAVKEKGILPTFYPLDRKIPMMSPQDVAAFVAGLLVEPVGGDPIYELEGPAWYSSHDVADAFAEALSRPVVAEQTSRDQWGDQLRKTGFTEDAIRNFSAMTELVAAGKAIPEGQGTIAVKQDTTLPQYIAAHVQR